MVDSSDTSLDSVVLDNETYQRVEMVEHKGTILAIAQVGAGAGSRFVYTTHGSGGEGWTQTQDLAFPKGLRAANRQIVTLPDVAAISSTLSADMTGDAWHARSDGRYVYLFRAVQTQKKGTTTTDLWSIWVNRYLLVTRPTEPAETADTMELLPRREARFQNSGDKDVPQSEIDKAAYKAPDGQWFEEPILNVTQSTLPWFAVEQTPSDAGITPRWLLFVAAEPMSGAEYSIRALSMLTDQSGLPLMDQGVVQQFVLMADLKLNGGDDAIPLAPRGIPATTSFRRQEQTPDPDRSGATELRVMLASRVAFKEDNTDKEAMLAIDFGLDARGVPEIDDSGHLTVGGLAQAKTALAFDGDGDILTIAGDAIDLLNSAAFTVEAWVRPDPGGHVVWWGNPETKIALEIHWDPTDQRPSVSVPFRYLDGSPSWSVVVSADEPFSTGIWHHVAAVVESTDWKDGTAANYNIHLYVDGVLRNSAKASDAPEDRMGVELVGALTLAFGRSPLNERDPTNDLSGTLDELAVWKQALSATDIKEGLDSTIAQASIDSGVVSGYWHLDDGLSDPDTATATCGRDGIVSGATWTTKSAPVFDAGLAKATKEDFGFASGLGLLPPGLSGGVFPPVGDYTDPTLLNGADGVVHLYLGQGSQAKKLGVLPYDTTIARAYFALPTETDDGSTPDPLYLAAKSTGPLLNSASATTVPGKQGHLSVALDANDALGISEAFEDVPQTLPAFSQVICGAASSDPLSPDVQTGAVPFYDYLGDRPFVLVPPDGTNPAPHGALQFVTAQLSESPSPLRVAGVDLGAKGGKATMAVQFAGATLNKPDATARVKRKAKRKKSGEAAAEEDRSLEASVVFSGLSPDAAILAEQIAGSLASATDTDKAPYDMHLEKAELIRIPGVYGSFYQMHAKKGGTWSVTITVADPASTTCTVAITDGSTSATWNNVPREPIGFANRLNMQTFDDGKKPNEEQWTLARSFVVIGTGVSGNVDAGLLPDDHSDVDVINVAAFFVLVAPNVRGTVPKGTFPADINQGMSIKDATGKAVPLSAPGSKIFEPVPPAGAAKDVVRRVRQGEAALAQPGNFGGWVPVPATLAGCFGPTAGQAVSVTPADAAALDVAGDFTFEAWLKAKDPGSGTQYLFNDDPVGTDRLSVGFAKLSDDYGIGAVSDGDTIVGVNPEQENELPTLFVGGMSGTFALEIDLNTAAAKAGHIRPIAKLSLMPNDSKYVTLYVQYERMTGGELGFRFFASQLYGGPQIVTELAKVEDRVFLWFHYRYSVVDGLKYFYENQTGVVLANKTLVATYTAHGVVGPYTLPWDVFLYPVLGHVGPVRQAALWRSWLDEDTLAQFAGHNISPVSEGLVALWRIVDLVGPNDQLPNLSRTPDAPQAELRAIKGTIGAVRTLPAPMMFGRGGNRVFATPELPDEGEWSHVAAVCSGNDAVKFDDSGAAIVQSGEGLAFDEAFAIEAFLDWTGDGSTERMICAKHYADDPNFATGGFVFYVTSDGKLAYRTVLSDGNLIELQSDKPLPTNKPAYVFASGSIYEEEKGESDVILHTGGVNRTVAGNQIDTKIAVQLGFWTFDAPIPRVVGLRQILATSVTGQTITFASTSAPFMLGGESSSSAEPDIPAPGSLMKATLATLRLWERNLSLEELSVLREGKELPSVSRDGLLAAWRCDEGQGTVLNDSAGDAHATLPNPYMWTNARISSTFEFYIDGLAYPATLIPSAFGPATKGKDGTFTLGAVETSDQVFTETYDGAIDEIRLWNTARTEAEIRVNAFADLDGGEAGLAAYWPVMAGSGPYLRDRTSQRNDGRIHVKDGASLSVFWAQSDEARPVGHETPEIPNLLSTETHPLQESAALTAAAAAESGVVTIDENGQPGAIMARFYAYVNSLKQLVFIDAFPVGEAWLNFLGQAQSDPTMIGYIEGAPPVPGENLNRPYWLSPATWQTYDGLAEVTLTEAEQVDYTYTANKDTGFDMELEGGVGGAFAAETDVLTAPLGLGISLKGANVEYQAGYSTNLSLQQGWVAAAQRQVGTRRGLVNTFSAGGDWDIDDDGKNGRYILDNTGYALVRSSVANVFGLRLKKTNTLIGIVMTPDPDIEPDFNLIHFPIDPNYTKQGTLDGMIGFNTDENYPEANLQRGSYYKPREVKNLEDQIEQFESELEADYEGFNAGKKGRRQEGVDFEKGDDPVADPGAVLDDDLTETYDFDESGDARNRRNLVNTYVWTADGGLFAETVQTTASRQETHGGNYTFTQLVGFGLEGKFTAPVGLYVDGKALFGGHIMATVEKSKDEAAEFEIEVVDDAESYLVDFAYDNKARHAKWQPKSGDATPGKVNGFRFKTFYLAPTDGAFMHFFDSVVDQQWLWTSDERSGRALREAFQNRAATWRVMHRVTYVSRVPPPFNRSPDESVSAPAMPVINVPQNRLLIDTVGGIVAGGDRGTLEQRIDFAVGTLLKDDLKEALPWWQEIAMLGDSDPDYVRIKTNLVTYLLAYAEDNPDWAR